MPFSSYFFGILKERFAAATHLSVTHSDTDRLASFAAFLIARNSFEYSRMESTASCFVGLVFFAMRRMVLHFVL